VKKGMQWPYDRRRPKRRDGFVIVRLDPTPFSTPLLHFFGATCSLQGRSRPLSAAGGLGPAFTPGGGGCCESTVRPVHGPPALATGRTPVNGRDKVNEFEEKM